MDISADNILKYMGEVVIKESKSDERKVILVGAEHSRKYPHRVTKAIVKYIDDDAIHSVDFKEIKLPRLELRAGHVIKVETKENPFNMEFKVMTDEKWDITLAHGNCLTGGKFDQDTTVNDLIKFIELKYRVRVIVVYHNGFRIYGGE